MKSVKLKAENDLLDVRCMITLLKMKRYNNTFEV